MDTLLQDLLRKQQVQDMQKKREQQARSEAARQQFAQQFAPMTSQTALAAPGAVGPTAARAGMIGQTPALDRNQLLSQILNPDLPPDLREAAAEAFKVTAPAEPKAAPGIVGEFQAAKNAGLITPDTTLAEYIQMKKPPAPSATATATTGGARVGTIPPGFELAEDPRTGALSMRPIPGGPAEKEQIAEAEKAEGRKAQQARAGGTVVQDLQRALNIVQSKPSATGRSASAILSLPEVARAETDVQAAKGFVESALSNVGLDTLQQMRENSPTGGALGQVPIQQQQRLEQVLGSLDLTQRKEVVEDNIKRVINIYMDIIHGSPVEVEEAYRNKEITKAQRDVFAFRHRLSFDELGNPLSKSSSKIPAGSNVQDAARRELDLRMKGQ
jgi:hypothetical protein